MPWMAAMTDKMALLGGTMALMRTRERDQGPIQALPALDEAVRRLADARSRVAPADLWQLSGLDHPGLYAWFVDGAGALHLTDGIGLLVGEGLIYSGQAGAGKSRATLGSRIDGNHLGSDIYGSTFRLTLTSALREQLALEPIGGGHMSRDGEGRLTEWMGEHLAVSVVAYPDPAGLDAFETLVLYRLDPPLNIAKRPTTPIRSRLTALRRVFSRRSASEPATEARARPAASSPRTTGTGPDARRAGTGARAAKREARSGLPAHPLPAARLRALEPVGSVDAGDGAGCARPLRRRAVTESERTGMTFEDIFKTGDARRDNFRSRLFGMFSEDVVRFWARGDAPYRALEGRPTIYEGAAHATIDFTLERRADGRRFIAEQKAELAWTGYAFLRLDDARQLDHHRGSRAFDWFMEAAREPAKRLVKTAGKVTPVDGAVLVWGAVSEQGRAGVRAKEIGLEDVLSLEEMIADLRTRRDPEWAAHVERLAGYASGLFEALT